jgi:glycosyltransferase involved in cell wall biosynthesis
MKSSLVKIHEYIRGFFKDYEIIVVNDGGTGNTANAVVRFCSNNEYTRLITY